ncbi:unnamed protein product [Amoebophrya sp. A25]|nr:unnamed protein product [Amoebophrya sp. A25]|eukprot:GSA25T00023936001.1
MSDTRIQIKDDGPLRGSGDSIGMTVLKVFPYVTFTYLTVMGVFEIINHVPAFECRAHKVRVTKAAEGVSIPAKARVVDLHKYSSASSGYQKATHQVGTLTPTWCLADGIMTRNAFLSMFVHNGFVSHFLPHILILAWAAVMVEIRIAYQLSIHRRMNGAIAPACFLVLMVGILFCGAGCRVIAYKMNIPSASQGVFVWPEYEKTLHHLAKQDGYKTEDMFLQWLRHSLTEFQVPTGILAATCGSGAVFCQFGVLFFMLFFIFPSDPFYPVALSGSSSAARSSTPAVGANMMSVKLSVSGFDKFEKEGGGADLLGEGEASPDTEVLATGDGVVIRSGEDEPSTAVGGGKVKRVRAGAEGEADEDDLDGADEELQLNSATFLAGDQSAYMKSTSTSAGGGASPQVLQIVYIVIHSIGGLLLPLFLDLVMFLVSFSGITASPSSNIFISQTISVAFGFIWAGLLFVLVKFVLPSNAKEHVR